MPRYSPRTGQLTEYQVGPYDSAHVYVQWGGKLPGGEQWSCGLRMTGTPATADADAAAMLPGIAAAVVAYHQRATTSVNAAAKLSFVKCNGIAVDGTYISEGTNEALYSDLAGGLAAGTVHPNQVTLAVTLATGFSRGPAHSGRFYLPMVALPVGADGLVSVVDTQNVETSSETFLTALNAVNAAWDVAIFSRKAGAPAHRVVTGVQVGRVLDTQRRRRRGLGEAYVG